MKNTELGSLAFKIGVAVAALSGIFVKFIPAYAVWVPLVLLAAGLAAGYLNLGKEPIGFLVAAIAILAAQNATGAFSNIPTIGSYLVEILQNLAAFVAPAAIIVSLKGFHEIAQSR